MLNRRLAAVIPDDETETENTSKISLCFKIIHLCCLVFRTFNININVQQYPNATYLHQLIGLS